MKEYELCIRDITRAFNYSYPNNLMYKLFERKSKCQKALGDHSRALESIKEAEMWMKYSTLSETKTVNFKKMIAKEIETLSERVANIADVSELKQTCPNSTVCMARNPPKFEAEANAEVPCARADVQLSYSPERGRYLAVTKDVGPGSALSALCGLSRADRAGHLGFAVPLCHSESHFQAKLNKNKSLMGQAY